jgi:hypothetical protein
MARHVVRLFGAVGLVVGAVVVLTWPRLCDRPLDFARAEWSSPALVEQTVWALPGVREVVQALTQAIITHEEFDPLTYASHAGLGWLLSRSQCDPVATGVQWLKAGAHSHSPAQVEMVAQGIAAARAASDDPAQFDVALCSYVGQAFTTDEQLTATEGGGVECRLNDDRVSG